MTLEQYFIAEGKRTANYLVIKRHGHITLLSRTQKGRIGADYFVALKHEEGALNPSTLIPCASFDDALSVYNTELAKEVNK